MLAWLKAGDRQRGVVLDCEYCCVVVRVAAASKANIVFVLILQRGRRRTCSLCVEDFGPLVKDGGMHFQFLGMIWPERLRLDRYVFARLAPTLNP